MSVSGQYWIFQPSSSQGRLLLTKWWQIMIQSSENVSETVSRDERSVLAFLQVLVKLKIVLFCLFLLNTEHRSDNNFFHIVSYQLESAE